MAQQTIDDNTLLAALFDIVRRHGYEGTTIAQLSAVTGLKKSSLYHRFPAGKDDMIKAVVAYVSAQLQRHLFIPLRVSQTAPEQRFDDMIATIKGFYGDGGKNCLLNVLSLGEARAEIKELLNQDYRQWLAALTQLAQDAGMKQSEAEQKSAHFLIVVQGALVIQRLTDDALVFGNCLDYERRRFFK